MKKAILLFCTFLSLQLYTFCQKEILDLSLNLSKTTNILSAPFIQNDYGYVAIYDKNELQRLLINFKDGSYKRFEEKIEITHPLYSLQTKNIFSLTNNDRSINLFLSEKNSDLVIELVNFITKTTKVNEIISLRKEELISVGKWKDGLLIITHPESSKKLRFHFKVGEEQSYAKDFDVTTIKYSDDIFSNEIKTATISCDERPYNNISATDSKFSLFYDSDKIVFVNRNRSGAVVIASIDIPNWKVSVSEKIYLAGQDPAIASISSEVPMATSTYSSDNFVFIFSVYSEKVSIRIFDISKNKIVKEIHLKKNEPIAFDNFSARYNSVGNFSFEDLKPNILAGEFINKVSPFGIGFFLEGFSFDSTGQFIYMGKKSSDGSGYAIAFVYNNSILSTKDDSKISGEFFLSPGFAFSWKKYKGLKLSVDKNELNYLSGKPNVKLAELYDDGFQKELAKKKTKVAILSEQHSFIVFYDEDLGKLKIKEY